MTSSTENFRRQHDELMHLAMELVPLLDDEALARDAWPARRQLARFVGKLAVHARMENDALYPRLLAHPDVTVSACAKALADEVGALYATFDAFARRWTAPGAIERDPVAFVAETQRMLRALGKRMVRENAELYPLVDALDAL